MIHHPQPAENEIKQKIVFYTKIKVQTSNYSNYTYFVFSANTS